MLIPAGKFNMGFSATETKVSPSLFEKQHEITITKPFFMGKYEVTQAQWEAIMGKDTLSFFKGPRLPVYSVSWNDCQEFIQELNRKTKGGYRLPTEAEWEYACRAGTTTLYSFGDKVTTKDVNCQETWGEIKMTTYAAEKKVTDRNKALGIKVNDPLAGTVIIYEKPFAVGSYKPNAFGLYDMHGNVAEWCNDWYDSSLNYGKATDPKGPVTGRNRVIRGGDFNSDPESLYSAGRGESDKPYSRGDYGFRLVRDK
jgi:formylglycine-generating enzyme required for sulfatase activity